MIILIGIYKIENLINHKIYIGQSVNIERRWNDEKRLAFDKTSLSYNYPISCALRKYGIENFLFEVLEECTKEQLNKQERYWIQYYDSFFNGYNQTLGGDSPILVQKEQIIGVITDLKNTDLYHKEIAQRWNISQEMVQGINTGRYWHQDNEDYPLQKKHKGYSRRGLKSQNWYCKKCGKKISKGANYCKECWDIEQRKVNRPSREELKKLIRTIPFTRIGKQFNVSDNTIRKWCISENLPSKIKDIKQYSDKDWDMI